MKKKMYSYIGWSLWGFGLLCVIGGTINAEKHSQIFVDVNYKIRTQEYRMRSLVGDDAWMQSKVKEELKYALESLRDELISTRKIGYITIGTSMGLGTLMILKSRRLVRIKGLKRH